MLSSEPMGMQVTVILKTATATYIQMWPRNLPQKIHPVERRAPVYKDIFTGISVTASYDMKAKNQTNKPSSLDTNRTFLFGGRELVMAHPSYAISAADAEGIGEASGRLPL